MTQYIPTFIWAYLGTATIIFAGALAHRRRLTIPIDGAAVSDR
jgi:hypothetical protein